MLNLVLLLVGAFVQNSSPAPAGSFTQHLYAASVAASGSKLCDDKQRTEYQKEFDARYGQRIHILTSYHAAHFGPEQLFVFTHCRRSTASLQEQDRRHAEALDRFDASLREFEKRYAPPPPAATNHPMTLFHTSAAWQAGAVAKGVNRR